jgi:hypothetical protein
MRLTRTQRVRGEVGNPLAGTTPAGQPPNPLPHPLPDLGEPRGGKIVKSVARSEDPLPPQAGGVIATGQRSHTLGIPLGSGHHVWSDPLVAW